MKKMIASMMLSAVAVPGLFAAAKPQSADTTKPTTATSKKNHKKHNKSTTATTAPAQSAGK